MPSVHTKFTTRRPVPRRTHNYVISRSAYNPGPSIYNSLKWKYMHTYLEMGGGGVKVIVTYSDHHTASLFYLF